jgi:hypothetical protein
MCIAKGEVAMGESVLVESGRQTSEMPRATWDSDLLEAAAGSGARLDFLSKEHHLLRNFVVSELPRVGRPISAVSISRQLDLPLQRIDAILEELEHHQRELT